MMNQSDTEGPLGKILTGSDGLGTVTPEMVEERALQLARTDGRTEANDGDRAQAKEEFLGPAPDVTGPEAGAEGLEQVTAWDDSPADHGSQAPDILPEDEANIAEVLVQEGLEEADHDRRVSAADAFPPEDEG
jgi:hypothetical protein